ncbi:MAG TPA: tetratricopeptide repeat protein [Ktedonobacteraceae bacterium]|jgi:tetratricopeptide (TPR) repeat protein|nr:tetratricopeptide repeat protein [Ktedonobacteraceae bacterium]
MGETLNLLFQQREDGTFELQVKESWSGHTVKGDFIPPFQSKQLTALLKRLNALESDSHELREIGQTLFRALCGNPAPVSGIRDSSEHSVQAMLRSVIQRTLRRRGTVALTLSFAPGCDDFVSYPWELLHNGEHFLLASGVFTLTRALLRQDMPSGCELPIYPPLRLLYIGASPIDCPALETELSFESLRRGLMPLIEEGQLYLDRLEPPTFDELVSYLSSLGGAGAFDDQETAVPCYVVHFDGHGAFGRLCPSDDCDELNSVDARRCSKCHSSLSRVKAQTYLCFCDDEGYNRYIGTESLRELFVSSDIRLAVFAACETARVGEQTGRQAQRRAAVDATLATALVTAQIPAVVAMPFSLQDDLTPTFMYHFYDALAHGRTLEEALSRARQAMLPIKQHSWFVPVLYRRVVAGEEGPVGLLAGRDEPQEHDHPLSHLGATTTFVGREREIQEVSELLTEAVENENRKGRFRMHHFALTGPAGIGKSELAFEVARRNEEKFPGGIIGISLQGGKTLGEALLEMAHYLRIHTKAMNTADTSHCERTVLNAFRSLANRDLPCLLLLDGFEEIQERAAEVGGWYRFLCSLPEQVIVLLTSRSNPSTVATLESASCRWYEYAVGKMTSQDILKLFAELAAGSGLDERIHLSEPRQQEILQEICTLLDGYPLGAQLIFGTARPIHGKIYAPEAATRSLEEVRDELRETLPEGMWALLDIAYRRLSPQARQLLPYLSAFKLPFSHQQIVMLIAPESLATARAAGRLEHEHYLQDMHEVPADTTAITGVPPELAKNWRAARDELVHSSFIQFDGRVYTIHSQVRLFALAYLSQEERRRVHRVVAAYYSSLPQPSPEEWFAAFEHLEDAGEPEDRHKAVHLIVRAAWALRGRGYASQLRALLRRAETYALSNGDKTGEGQIQYCLGSILRQLGKYPEALGCLTRSLTLHREQRERDEAAWALYELAMLFREQGQYQQAGEHAQEALVLFREANDAKGIAWMQTVLGEVSRGRGYYYEALGHFTEALAAFRGLMDDDGYAWALRDRGTVHEALGKYTEAMTDYEESQRLFQTLGSRYGQAWVLADQSGVEVDLARFEQASKHCNEALTIFREQGARRGEAWVLHVLGDLARKKRQYDDARAYYSESLAIFNDLGDRVDQARVINALGAIAFTEGAYPVAKEHYEHACAIAHEQEAKQIEGRALRGSGDVARIMRQYAEADKYYCEALDIAQKLDTPGERCALLHRQGELACAQEQFQDALAAWVEALSLDHRIGHPEREEHQNRVDAFVAEKGLESLYKQLCRQYGLN